MIDIKVIQLDSITFFVAKSLLHNWFIKTFFKKKMRFDNFRWYYYNL